MTIAIFAGSFDPVTKGHIDIIKRASVLFDEITVLVMPNPAKTALFSIDKRVKMIKDCLNGINNVKVDTSDGLTATYCKKYNISYIIRGIRNQNDYEYEARLARMNKELNNDLETIFFNANKDFVDYSSTIIKELLSFNTDIKKYVPIETYKYYTTNN